MVEDLSTEAIINSIMGHIYRFGRAKVIETDCGTNYKGAQRLLQAEEELASVEWPLIRSKLKSSGIELVMRGAKMPWVTGGGGSWQQNVEENFTPKQETKFVCTKPIPGVCDVYYQLQANRVVYMR